MSVEVRAGASRPALRALGFRIVGGLAIAAVLVPLLARAFSGSEADVATFTVFVAGLLIFALAPAIGFATSRNARRAAAALTSRNPASVIEYGRIAPENFIAALAVKPGELAIWLDEGHGPVLWEHVSGIQSVALTSERIWGYPYYALEVASADSNVLIVLGTRSTWGAAEASRKAHLRLGETLLGRTDAAEGRTTTTTTTTSPID